MNASAILEAIVSAYAIADQKKNKEVRLRLGQGAGKLEGGNLCCTGCSSHR
jgi:hypothetical protein